MKNNEPWEHLLVKQLFQSSNWSGKKLNQGDLVTNSKEFWQCFSVQDFFCFNNWNGKSKTFVNPLEVTPNFSMNLLIGDFFQCFNWEASTQKNRPKVYPVSTVNSLPKEDRISKATEKFTLENLSQLF